MRKEIYTQEEIRRLIQEHDFTSEEVVMAFEKWAGNSGVITANEVMAFMEAVDLDARQWERVVVASIAAMRQVQEEKSGNWYSRKLPLISQYGWVLNRALIEFNKETSKR